MRFLALLCCFVSAASANEWQKLSNCQLIETPYNDGDSFHVRHEVREFIFRLGYVDCPETQALKEFTERTTDQAKYFGINKTQLFQLADDASALTKELLKQPFTVWTDGTDAKGNSQLARTFVIIQTASGEDLGEVIVERGLARVYGYSPPRPDGVTSSQYRKKLKELEQKAFDQKRGAWAETRRKSPPLYGTQLQSGTAPPPSERNPKSSLTPHPSYVPAI